MAMNEQWQNTERSHGTAAAVFLALTPKVFSDLQVCLSSVELLQGMTLPAEAHLPVDRLTRAVDALVAAAATARRPTASIEDRLSVGSRAERS